jgi:hypothetical protein
MFLEDALNPSGGHYDVAQVCLNGHLINGASVQYPNHNEKFCGKCGEPTVTNCETCKSPIRGIYHHNGPVLSEGLCRASNFCHQCGKSYPWAVRGLQAAKELADEMEELEPNERDALKKSLDELVKDSPAAEIAGVRFKKLMKKAGGGSVEVMKSVVSDLLSETIRKSIFGQ